MEWHPLTFSINFHVFVFTTTLTTINIVDAYYYKQ